MLDNILLFFDLLTKGVTAFAAAIAIWVFFFRRKAISSALRMLTTFSYQLTLTELKEKLERLNEYSASEPDHQDNIINILHEVLGQIRGNRGLAHEFESSVNNIEALCIVKNLTEPRKRALVSQLREQLRHIDVKNFDQLMSNSDE